MVALLLAAPQFLHDAFLSELEIFFCELPVLGHGAQRRALLVDDFVENHLQVLVGVVAFLSDVLDLRPYACNFVVFFSNVDELAFEAILEDVWREQELGVVEWFCLIINLSSNLVVGVFLLHGQLVVLVEEDLALPLKLLEVVE